jgi:hypothetical protein
MSDSKPRRGRDTGRTAMAAGEAVSVETTPMIAPEPTPPVPASAVAAAAEP